MDFELTMFELLPHDIYTDHKHMNWYVKMMTAAYNQALEDVKKVARWHGQHDIRIEPIFEELVDSLKKNEE